MERKILFMAAVLLGAAGLALAQEGELHGVVDVTYLTKYMWRGYDVYDDKSAIQPRVNLDLYGTGFGLEVFSSRANSSGFENGEWLRGYLYYDNMCLADDQYQTNYRIGYYYYNFPDNSAEDFDLQEMHAIMSWPKVLGIEGLVPTYILCKLWPAHSDSLVGSRSPLGGTASGFGHILMLDYAWEIQCPMTNEPRVLNLHAETCFNDGVGPQGQNTDHDWSHMVLGVSTDFDLRENLVLTPALYYQVTFDDSVVAVTPRGLGDFDKDEFWAGLSLKYKF